MLETINIVNNNNKNNVENLKISSVCFVIIEIATWQWAYDGRYWRGHPFSTYAVRGRGGGVNFAYFPMSAHIKIAYREGRGSKMAKMLRTYYMDAPEG